jgi:hypothetical protein
MLGAPKKAPAGPGLGQDKVGVPEFLVSYRQDPGKRRAGMVPPP